MRFWLVLRALLVCDRQHLIVNVHDLELKVLLY